MSLPNLKPLLGCKTSKAPYTPSMAWILPVSPSSSVTSSRLTGPHTTPFLPPRLSLGCDLCQGHPLPFCCRLAPAALKTARSSPLPRSLPETFLCGGLGASSLHSHSHVCTCHCLYLSLYKSLSPWTVSIDLLVSFLTISKLWHAQALGEC